MLIQVYHKVQSLAHLSLYQNALHLTGFQMYIDNSYF